MQLNGYEVWITCDGEALPEFQAQVEGDGKTMGCFIPSESGKEFVIHWHDHVGTTWLSYGYTLDGKRLSHANLSSPGVPGKVAGVLTGADIEQPFQFADLRTSDDDSLLDSVSSNADLGTIQVSVRRVHEHYTVIPFTPATFNAVETVHERSKKAGAHNIALGKGSRIAAQPHQYLTRHEPIDPSEGYVATFVFRYRPRPLLQAQGIMPPPSPSLKEEKGTKRTNEPVNGRPAKRPKMEPGTSTVDLGVIEISDDEEDLNLLQSRLREIQKQVDRAKRKKAGQSAAGGTVKKEPIASHPVGDPNDVIDLTED